MVFEIYFIDESYKQLSLLLQISLVMTTAGERNLHSWTHTGQR